MNFGEFRLNGSGFLCKLCFFSLGRLFGCPCRFFGLGRLFGCGFRCSSRSFLRSCFFGIFGLGCFFDGGLCILQQSSDGFVINRLFAQNLDHLLVIPGVKSCLYFDNEGLLRGFRGFGLFLQRSLRAVSEIRELFALHTGIIDQVDNRLIVARVVSLLRLGEKCLFRGFRSLRGSFFFQRSFGIFEQGRNVRILHIGISDQVDNLLVVTCVEREMDLRISQKFRHFRLGALEILQQIHNGLIVSAFISGLCLRDGLRRASRQQKKRQNQAKQHSQLFLHVFYPFRKVHIRYYILYNSLT